MKLKVLRVWKGVLSIAGGALAPWAAFALHQAALPITIILSFSAAIAAGGAWVDSSLTDLISATKKRKGEETIPPKE